MHHSHALRFALVLVTGFSLIHCGGESEESFSIVGSASSTAAEGRLDPSAHAVEGTPAGSPTSFNVRLYSAYVAESADCSNPILLADYGAEGQLFDMFAEPTLFSGSPPNGTYNCLILQFSDVMSFLPDFTAAAAHPACADTSQEYQFDVYREGNSSGDDGTWVDLTGSPTDATGTAAAPGADKTWVFASTGDYTAVTANGSPISEHQSLLLTAPLVVPGEVTLYLDALDSLTTHEEDGVDYCWCEQITMGFR